MVSLIQSLSALKNPYTPLLVIRSLDQIKEDVEELVSLFRLWVKAGGAQYEWDQLLKEKTKKRKDRREKRHQ